MVLRGARALRFMHTVCWRPHTWFACGLCRCFACCRPPCLPCWRCRFSRIADVRGCFCLPCPLPCHVTDSYTGSGRCDSSRAFSAMAFSCASAKVSFPCRVRSVRLSLPLMACSAVPLFVHFHAENSLLFWHFTIKYHNALKCCIMQGLVSYWPEQIFLYVPLPIWPSPATQGTRVVWWHEVQSKKATGSRY